MRKKRLLLEKIALALFSIITFFALLWLVNIVDPIVNFPDSGLEAAILEKVEKAEPPIHKSDLNNITKLDASYRQIRYLQGIEKLKRLVSLNLEGNEVTDLTPLAGLSHLTELNLSNNSIIDLHMVNFHVLRDLPLRKLNLSHNAKHFAVENQVRMSDISLLKNHVELKELELRGNNLVDISALSSLYGLISLDLRENMITDISDLSALNSLEKLNLRENNIRSITPLAGLQQLRYLNIHSNVNIESIAVLSSLSSLETLIMRNVPVREQVKYLSNLKNLKRLNIRNCEIKDLTVINELIGLRTIQDETAIEILSVVDVRDNIGQPEFSYPGGFYKDEFYLQLTPTVEGVSIYYTLDGSEPDPLKNADSTHLYNEPIEIIRSEGEPNELSLNGSQHSGDRPDISGNYSKATVVRAASFSDYIAFSDVKTNTYFFDNNIYDRYNLPIISLSTDSENFFGFERGIYVSGKVYEDTSHIFRELSPKVNYHYHPANFHMRGRVIINAGGVEAKAYGLDRVALYMPAHGLDLKFSYLRDVPQISIVGTENYDGFYYLDSASTSDWLVFEAPFASEIFPSGAQIIKNWERPVHVEFYESDGSLAFSQGLGVRIHGGVSRTEAQKSLRFYARGIYDDQAMINYQLFPCENQNHFKRFILRKVSDLNDIIGHQIMLKVHPEIDIQRYRPVIVFLNGEFWGLYALRDRHDDWSLALKYGIKPEDIAIVEARHRRNFHFEGVTSLSDINSFVILEDQGKLRYGSPEDEELYRQMDRLIRRTNLTDPDNYKTIKNIIDIDNYTAWMITGIYLNYIDWGTKHTQAWRYRNSDHAKSDYIGPLDGRWRWLPVDLDCVFTRAEGPHKNHLSEIAESELYYLKYLLDNKDYRIYFINRFADLLNTVFMEKAALKVVREITNDLPDQVIEEHIRRWGYMNNLEGWNNYINSIEKYLHERPDHMRRHINDYFGLSGLAKVDLKIDAGDGYIEINTIKITEETMGVDNPRDWSGYYFKGLPITVTAVPAKGYVFKGWEGQFNADNTISVILTGNQTFTAIFTDDFQ